MMKTLIIEDEKAALRNLKAVIGETAADLEIVGETDSVLDTVQWFKDHPMPDLVFMDIHLADGSAFEIFEYVAIKCPIIFTTAYDEYAIQAFKYNSFDYLLKPINSEELAEAINKVRRRTLSDTHGEDMRRLVEYMYRNNYRYRERFLLPYRDGYISVQVKNISHIALKERTTLIFLNDMTINKSFAFSKIYNFSFLDFLN